MVTIETEVYLILDNLKNNYVNLSLKKDLSQYNLNNIENKINYIETIQRGIL